MTKDTRKRIESLLLLYMQQKASPQQRQELSGYLLQEKEDGEWEELMEELMLAQPALSAYNEVDWQPFVQQVLQQAKRRQAPGKLVRMRRALRWVAAAAVILMIAAGAYYWYVTPASLPAPAVVKHDVEAPKSARAMITLADGQKIYLDSAGNGTLTTQGNIQVVKLADGQIAYQNATGQVTAAIQYNTLENPRGSRVIDITLADGSRVWLNAGSSVTYPVAFTGNERNVSITGEAYFEVAHNAAKPFYVSKGTMQVQVLGTHFNVNAYDDEDAIRVTLLEGSVKVTAISSIAEPGKSGIRNLKSEILKPGEQAQVSEIRANLPSGSQVHVIRDIDPEQVMAWKNGLFKFNDASIEVIMRQLEKWYNVEVVYEGKVTEHFISTIPRDVPVSDVFKVLQATGRVHFTIEGRKIIVTP